MTKMRMKKAECNHSRQIAYKILSLIFHGISLNPNIPQNILTDENILTICVKSGTQLKKKIRNKEQHMEQAPPSIKNLTEIVTVLLK